MTQHGPILLFGANGQVGWELRRALAPIGPVRALARADIDLADRDALAGVIRDVGPSLIVNAAAYTAVDRAEEETDAAMAINGDAPGVMAQEARSLGVGLVHYSTDYVFDGDSDRPWRECDDPNPVSVYGKSKLAGEEAIGAAGCDHLIFRTSWVYSMRGANFLLTMSRLAGEREELRVVDDQVGAPTWARMIAEATAIAVASCRDGMAEHSGVYHLAAAGSTNWHGFASAIVDWMQRTGQTVRCERVLPIPTENYPTPAKRPMNSLLDQSKLKQAFGLQMPDWRDQFNLCVAA